MKGQILFLIPARGGSRGLPGKNLAMLAGIPLVGRAARLGRLCLDALGGDGRVVCSTDDPRIAEVAREWGAETPFLRPVELAGDDVGTLDVVRHALDVVGDQFEAVVLLQPTSPLAEPEDVLGAVAVFRETGAPVISVCRSEHPPEWHFRMRDKGVLVPILDGTVAHQRQQREEAYRPNGAIYVASPQHVRTGGFWTTQTRGFVMPPERSVDVDTAADLEVARGFLAERRVQTVEIAGRTIGPGHPCFIIAEAGVNHNGDVDLARRLIDAAAAAGADAVKFQTFRAESVVSPEAAQAEYQVRNTGRRERQLDMIKRLELDADETRLLRDHCEEKGILFLSTPFDEASADLLEGLGVPAFKVGSGELTNHRFLRYLAAKGKPVLVSTGMATLREVDEALAVIRTGRTSQVCLLHCVSSYPAPPEESNLRVVTVMRQAFDCPVGWSDHTLGTHVAVAAVALGADVIEKHFTLDRSLPGPDHAASLEPEELAALVRQVREVERALGDGVKRRMPCEEDVARVARRSVHAARSLHAGQVLRDEDLVALRPGTGIPAHQLGSLVGRRLARAVRRGEMLTWADIDAGDAVS